MRTTFQIIAFAVCIVFSAQSQAQTGEIFPKGELSTTKNHTGNIWLNELNVGDSTFDAGAGRIADKIAAINLPAGLTLAVSPICGTSSPTDCSSPFSKATP